jgi:hypothetical protein
MEKGTTRMSLTRLCLLAACLLIALAPIASAQDTALPAVLPEVTPDEDPLAFTPIELVPAVRGKHPRLLFSAADVPAMKQFAQGEGKQFFDRLLEYLPSCRAPEAAEYLTDDTDGLRQGLWRMPTVALHYVLTGDPQSRERAAGYLQYFIAQEHWQLGPEQDAGMGSANIFAGFALTYDWLYNDLDPALREQARQKLLLMARRQYYAGHLQLRSVSNYWQQDPQNNHRWHRDAGLSLAVLAVAGDGPGDGWLRARTYDELRFIHQWLPEDGTCHESPGYMVFGGPYLTLAMQASDHCFGTHYLDHPFFKNTTLFRLHTLLPDYADAFPFGDAGGAGYFNNYFFKCTAQNRQADLQDGLERFLKASPDSFTYGWFSLLWYRPLRGGSLEHVPTTALYPDLGVALVRESWNTNAVGAMFKCGPYGGQTLNEYRNANGFHYVNVAHDDPDANMFVIFADRQLLADDDRYSTNKITSNHNTILVNGKGQKGEGGGWTQPLGGVDMSSLARLTTWKSTGDIVVAEGEAAGLYDGLSRYRRTFIWVRGGYILVLDDIRAEQPADLTWLVQGPEVVPVADGAWRLQRDKAGLDFHVASDRPFTDAITDSTADSHGRPMGLKQLQLTAKTDRWRLATVFDPWHRRGLRVELGTAKDRAGGGATVVHVTGPGIDDTWWWRSTPGGWVPTTISGSRPGGFTIAVGPEDQAPISGGPVTR